METPLTGASNAGGVGKNCDSRPVSGFVTKTTEQHLVVHSDKSETRVTNNKRLRSRYCTVKATDAKVLSGFSAITELPVLISLSENPVSYCHAVFSLHALPTLTVILRLLSFRV